MASMSNKLSSDSHSNKKSSSSKTKSNKNYYKSSRSKSRQKTKNLRKRTHSSLISNNSSRNQNHNNHNSHNNNNNNNSHNNHILENLKSSSSKYSNISRNHISKHNKKNVNNSHHISSSQSHSLGPSKEKIIQYKKNLYSDDIEKQLFAVSQLRILLSDEQQPPIELVIRSNCVPRLIEILSARKNINLLFETAWVLTNICSGSHEHTMAVVEANGIECILSLLDLTDIPVLEQLIWVLGNIAGDGTNVRDICLNKGVLTRLILLAQQQQQQQQQQSQQQQENKENMNGNNATENEHHKLCVNGTSCIGTNSSMPLSFQRIFVWTISNLVRGKPQPLWNRVSCVIPIILLYLNCCDIEVLTDICWALSYLSDGCNEHIQSILDLSLLSSIDISEYLVNFLDKKSMNVLVPALRTCGNIVSGSDHQTQQIIDRGLLSKLLKLLRHPNHSVKKEAIWTVSNITAGNSHQIQLVIDNGLIEPLIDILTDYNSDHDLVKECIWAISNAITGGTNNQLKYLSQYGSIGLARVMTHFPNDKKLQLVLLESLDNLLSFTNKNPIPLSQSPLANMLLYTIQSTTINNISYCNNNNGLNSINNQTQQYIKDKQYNDIIIDDDFNEDDTINDIYNITDNDDDDEYFISDDAITNYDTDEINGNQNYVAYIMEQTEAHRILEKWFWDINQDRDVKHLAHEIYKKYFNVPYQF